MAIPTKILAPIVGGIVLVGIMVCGGIAVRTYSAATRSPVPSAGEVCDHLASIGAVVPDCPAWLTESEASYGEYGDNRLRCYTAAPDVAAVKRCDEPAVYMSDAWEG